MAPLFAGASSDVLRSLEDAFRAGRLGASVSRMAMNRVCACPESVADDVMRLLGEGLSPGHMALLLGAHADAMEARMSGALPLELVWTGPEGPNARSRDTSVVVRELFEKAQTSILVSTFVIRQGQRVLEPLARRMDLVPALRVQMFLHAGRDWRDTRHDSELLRECAGELRKAWPGTRYPDVYYDPRGLAAKSDERATWHPKCVLVDDEVAFVTSANFTEWAQTRNVEAGVVIRDRHFTEQLRAQFEGLVQGKQVARLPGF